MRVYVEEDKVYVVKLDFNDECGLVLGVGPFNDREEAMDIADSLLEHTQFERGFEEVDATTASTPAEPIIIEEKE